MDDVSNFSPAIAVPMTVKMPDPMTAPMPSAVSETGPSVFRRLFCGSSDSAISLSMDLVAKSWLGRVRAPQIMLRGVYPQRVCPAKGFRGCAGAGAPGLDSETWDS
jgi:hypothetical protein